MNLSPRELISPLVKQGLQGIEFYYPWQDVTGQPPEWYATIDSQLALLDELAEEFKLILTGGSDYHGPVPGKADLGSIPVPVSRLESLQQRYKALFGKLPSTSKPA